jgi:formate hydrogenlyase subunit 3/multisubunit Na+/H+ antiporter MnhD subunit
VLGLLPVTLVFLPRRQLVRANIAGISLVSVISAFWAVRSLLQGETITLPTRLTFWGEPLALIIDPLTAFFILVVNFTCITGAFYATGYVRSYLNKSKTELVLHFISYTLLHYSMLLVTMLQTGLAFLFAWELMSVSSFFLVIFEGEKRETLRAGINYLIQMHIAMLFLLIGFVLLEMQTSEMSFPALSSHFAHHANFGLFLIFFIGFSFKAGFMPLHTWLPHAHPAAPSYISAVMSGVMIKMGIYGILRVLMHVQRDFVAIGSVVFVVATVSGLLGVMIAIVQHDLKRLLAYHSIENIGIIGMGIGLGLIGLGIGNQPLAVLGLSGGLLHVLNHSLFKSLLFYAAGSVYTQCHTRSLDALGGLIKKMPQTAMLFLIGAIAICGLPPFNGFISEFLIYKAALQGLQKVTLFTGVFSLMTLSALALIGGLAIFCFAKAFGIVFLGTGRSQAVTNAGEVASSMRYPLFAIVIVMLSIGVLPGLYLRVLSPIVAQFVPGFQTLPLPLTGTMTTVGLAAVVFVLLSAGIYWLRSIKVRRSPIAAGSTWGCGYTGPAQRMQYTATSFAENYTHLAAPLLNIEKHYETIAESEIFPKKRKFETHSADLVEDKVYMPGVALARRVFDKATVIQSGHARHYVMYAFAFILFLFLITFLNLI